MDLSCDSMFEILQMKGKGLSSLININEDGIQLMEKMFRFSPKTRITPYEAMSSPFFDPIRKRANCLLTKGAFL
jgi:hypothetical protein